MTYSKTAIRTRYGNVAAISGTIVGGPEQGRLCVRVHEDGQVEGLRNDCHVPPDVTEGQRVHVDPCGAQPRTGQ